MNENVFDKNFFYTISYERNAHRKELIAVAATIYSTSEISAVFQNEAPFRLLIFCF